MPDNNHYQAIVMWLDRSRQRLAAQNWR